MFGDHAAFIVPAYLITALVMGGVFVWIRAGYARHRKELAELEKQGVRRRSEAVSAGSKKNGKTTK